MCILKFIPFFSFDLSIQLPSNCEIVSLLHYRYETPRQHSSKPTRNERKASTRRKLLLFFSHEARFSSGLGLGWRIWGDTSTHPVRCVLPNSLCSHALHVLSVQAGLGSDRAWCIAKHAKRETTGLSGVERASVCVCVWLARVG